MELDLSDRLQRLIYIKRSYEDETAIALIPYLKKARCFVDIGANVGYFSLLAKAMNRDCHVFSIEPLPLNTTKLIRNRDLNHFEKMEIIDVCISDRPGLTEFIIPPGDERGWGRIAYKPMFDGHRIQRNVETLDRLLTPMKLEFVDVIKIDIEGFEFKALLGMKEILKKHQPLLCIELNELCLVDLGTSGNEVLTWLKTQGYTTFSIRRNGDLLKTDRVQTNYNYLNYIAIPNSKRT